MAEEHSIAGARLLLLYGEAHATPEVVFSLLDCGVEPVVAFRQGKRSAARELRGMEVVELPAPEVDVAAAVDAVARVAEERGCAGVFPLEDPAVLVAHRLAFDIRRIGVTGDLVDLVFDKRRQFQLASAAGFQVPPWFAWPGDGASSSPPIPDGVPVVVKSALAGNIVHGRFDRGGIWFEPDRVTAVRKLSESPPRSPVIVQTAVYGVGEGLFGFGNDGRIRSPSAHRRLRMTNPAGSGSCACVSRIPDSFEIEAASRFVDMAGWNGMFMLELLRDDTTGHHWFMELNGRPWGSLALARRQGLEYPAWEARFRLNGEEPSDIESKGGLVCRHLGREIVHFMHLIRGNKKKAPNWPSASQRLGLLKWAPSHCWYNYDSRQPLFFIRDAIASIRSQLK